MDAMNFIKYSSSK